MSVAHSPTETIDSLHALKRRIYLCALAAGLLAIGTSWLYKAYAGTETIYEQLIFPVLTVLCFGSFLAVWRTERARVWAEWLLFAATALSLLGRLAEVVFTTETSVDPDHLAAFTDLLYWFPLVYVLGFLMFEGRRRLLVASLLFFGASLFLGLAHGFADWRASGEIADLYVLTRFYAANLIYIVLLLISSHVNEQYVRLRLHADAMTELAQTDTLLPLANRREIEATLAREVNRAVDRRRPLCVIMFDLDHFKAVNDSYGHETGDRVLKATTDVCKSLIRPYDTLGRWGGEEFVVIAPETTSTQSAALAERLRVAIAGNPIERAGTVTASFGVAQFSPPETTTGLLERADAALYAAKHAGRNQVSVSAATSLQTES